jgi:hypothetical protein
MLNKIVLVVQFIIILLALWVIAIATEYAGGVN